MKNNKFLSTLAIIIALFSTSAVVKAQTTPAPIQAQQDKYQWLEEVDGKKALEFAEAQNKVTLEKLSKEKDYQSIYDKSLEILNSTEKIAYPDIQGKYVYNFWKDKDHVRGI